MTRNEQFFYDNAGFSYDPKTETAEQGRLRCAVAMAKAEQWLNDNDYEYSVEPDCDCDMRDVIAEQPDSDHEAVGVCLRKPDGGYLPYSIWGVIDADQNYLRVLVAELALEAMHDAERNAHSSELEMEAL